LKVLISIGQVHHAEGRQWMVDENGLSDTGMFS